MPEFLSAEWVAALDGAARDADGLVLSVGQPPFAVEYRVRTSHGDTATHHIVFTSGGTRVAPGAVAAPDIVMTSDLATARSILLGTTNAQRALTTGSLRIDGDMGTLAAHAELLLAVDDVFASIRSTTTFSVESDR